MKKWLPYIVAAVLGVGVAVLMFLPDTSTGNKSSSDPAEKPRMVTKVVDGKMTMNGGTPDAPSDAERISADRAKGVLAPEPGSLRPLNEGELARADRAARPFNKHYKLVAPFWSIMGTMVGPTDPEVARECAAMDLYLRDQSKLADDDLNAEEALQNELALEKKVRTLGIANDKLNSYLDYINNSAHTTIQGGDPSTIVKPGKG
ncbi:MAG: hypothetical protein EXR69_03155 [Myxococcales bacterium]|nr:hypothetical protein [Myxococcales bacterium]